MPHAAAVEHLRRSDSALAGLIERVGPYRLTKQRCSPYESLVKAIVYQQLSGKAAGTIYGRVRAACAESIEPAVLSRLRDEELRAVGLSGQKVRYVRDLTERVAAGSLDLTKVRKLEDEAVIEALTEVKGIGRWSAQMFLMFYLARPDVLPVGDLGIRKSAQNLYKLRKLPDETRLTKLAAPWRPFRSVACWYLWRGLGEDAEI